MHTFIQKSIAGEEVEMPEALSSGNSNTTWNSLEESSEIKVTVSGFE